MPHLTTIRFRVSHPECRCVGARAANVMRIPAMDVDMSVAVLAAKYIFVFKLRVFFLFILHRPLTICKRMPVVRKS